MIICGLLWGLGFHVDYGPYPICDFILLINAGSVDDGPSFSFFCVIAATLRRSSTSENEPGFLVFASQTSMDHLQKAELSSDFGDVQAERQLSV